MKKTGADKKKLKLEAETLHLLLPNDEHLKLAVGGAPTITQSTRQCRPTSDTCQSDCC